ncbi:MAG: hypothetical protein KKB95_01005 [Gammaproteobacteria bacterium]|jgi:hypothetical protein|nr:hypothetical protein [Gammaproteobacteria bacterium]MBU1350451.1 hypothetical protein [Gammaproteobacteria bacterium]MBU1504453.1 hypothetical protein [Gammaproteobacteria bacterium]MBU1817800.1 hypothetical protein [Gammaproteobacteria bacterium]MBU2118945.1 hypothetical protein [Gammaproteobacteria bacterium]
MSSALAFAPLVLLPVVLTVSVKAAAWVFKRTQLGWGHAFGYGVIASLVNMAGMLTARMPAPPSIPLPVLAAVSLLAVLALGGWYLGPRAKTAAGDALRFKGGVVVCLIAWLMLVAVSVAIFFASALVI